jgi:hypothetical protein
MNINWAKSIHIYNAIGQLVFQNNIDQPAFEMNLELPSGIYTLVAASETEQQAVRVIIE